MTKHEKLIREVREKIAKDMDIRVVTEICNHPLRFTASVMRDPDDLRPIRWRYWGVFDIIKSRKKKRKDEDG
jgi:hypothetical protein